ncbi:MAG: nicotinate (nicotinamide) nucleotide adenylyltransferase [Ignavibacteriae bacterium HGW-Ignavibacteriae-4]|nr:MAG: nicotinate (nicotinamide) nucleotide adenylyltransferase [Ignavibacteriae bacterium HGW-Ignavibacteriae-4]
MIKKIGLLGGSFNPIHEAHTSVANYFVEHYNGDKVIFVPCNVSPFKSNESIAPNNHRLEMVKLAIENNSLFEVSEFELENSGISYTYQTIDYFKKLYPEDNLCLLVGGDQAENFHNWKNWQYILDNAELYVALRKGYKIPSYDFESYKKATYMEMPFIEVSASEIREKIVNRATSIEFLNPKVKSYIEEHKVY